MQGGKWEHARSLKAYAGNEHIIDPSNHAAELKVKKQGNTFYPFNGRNFKVLRSKGNEFGEANKQLFMQIVCILNDRARTLDKNLCS